MRSISGVLATRHGTILRRMRTWIAITVMLALPIAAAPAKKKTTMQEEAAAFVRDAEAKLADMNVEQQRAAWIAENFITYDTQVISAQASEKQINLGVDLAKKAAKYDKV